MSHPAHLHARDVSLALVSRAPLEKLLAYLDLTTFGRQETWEDSPPGWPQTPPYQWQRRHDDYEVDPGA